MGLSAEKLLLNHVIDPHVRFRRIPSMATDATLSNIKNCPECKTKNVPKPSVDPWFESKYRRSAELVADFADEHLFTGRVGAWIHETGSTAPATVIDVDDEWQVEVHINTAGFLTHMWCGWWCVRLCCECICGDMHHRFPKGDPCCWLVPIDPCCGCRDFTITVPAYAMQESVCGDPCKCWLIITHITPCKIKEGDDKDPRNYRPGAIAGSVELPNLTFYSAAESPAEEEE